MLTLQAGKPVLEGIRLAYGSNLPILLEGRHGAGKSELLAEAARALNIELIVRDLSLMEPPDLIGIPRVGDDGRTHYMPPSFLPADGRGLLAFEELNRCPRYMQGPCLQLLVTRTLNDYALPAGWLPCAAINSADDGYLVDQLDPALLSRFLRIRVVPDVVQWADWARNGGRVHDKVVQFVEHSPGVFDDPDSNPRSWTYVSSFLRTWESGERISDILTTCLAGLVSEKWALSFLQFYNASRRPLTAQQVIENYAAHRASMKRWIANSQLDVVNASLETLKRRLQRQQNYDAVVADPTKKANVQAFFSDLPPDLRRDLNSWLNDRGLRELAVSQEPR